MALSGLEGLRLRIMSQGLEVGGMVVEFSVTWETD